MNRLPIAFGAGAAAALLLVIVSKGTLLAEALSNLAPLPIVIATIGWGIDIGGIATMIAIAGVAAFFEPYAGLAFAAAVTAPAWLLSAIVIAPIERIPLLNRRVPMPRGYFSAGTIVSVAVAIGILAGCAYIGALSLRYGSYALGMAAVTADFAAKYAEAMADEGLRDLLGSGEMSLEDSATLMARLWPAMIAAGSMLLLCVNVYLGARAVQLSQRLPRPWSALPEALRLPRAFGVIFIVCVGAAFVLHGAPRHLAAMSAGVFGAAYALQGYAVAHALSRGLSFRAPLLIIVYLASAFALPLVVAVGLAESLLSLRARRAAAARP